MERFNRVLKQTILTAYAENKDPVEEVDKVVAAYWNTSHLVTGQKPSKLMFNREVTTKLPRFTTASRGQHHREARQSNWEAKLEMKKQYDKKHRTKLVEVNIGDWAYIRRMTTNSTKGPWEPIPFQIVKVHYNQITGTRHGEEKTRDRSDWKLLVARPAHLADFQPRRQQVGTPEALKFPTPAGGLDDYWDDNDDTPGPVTRTERARRQRGAGGGTGPPPQPTGPPPQPNPTPTRNLHTIQEETEEEREAETDVTPPTQPTEAPPPPAPPIPPIPPSPPPNYNKNVCPTCHVMVKLTDKRRTCSCMIQKEKQGLGADYKNERLYLLDNQEQQVGTISYIRGLENHPLRGIEPDIQKAIDLLRRTNTRRPPDKLSSSDESERENETEDDSSGPCHGFSTPTPSESEEEETRAAVEEEDPENEEDERLRNIVVPEDIAEEDRPQYRRILAIIQGKISPEQPPTRRSTTRDDLLDQPDAQDNQPDAQDKTRLGLKLQRTPAFKRKRK